MPNTTGNPLLGASRLPAFGRIAASHVEPAIEALLAEGRAAIEDVLRDAEADGPTWDNLVAPLEAFDHRLRAAWSPVGHLHAVADEPALRDAYNACLPLLSAFAAEREQNARLCAAYRRLAESPRFEALDEAGRKVVENALRDFRLGGVELPAGEQARYREIVTRLASLRSVFGEHVLDATQSWKIALDDDARLAGLPASAREAAARAAERDGREGYVIGLDAPSFLAVQCHAEDRALREEVYRAYVTRASEQGPDEGRFDNGPVMEEILALRHEMARLLGFPDYAALSLARKMAPSTAAVVEFLRDLARRTRPVAERELASLRRFAREHHGLDEPAAWDLAWLSERQRERELEVNQEELRPYFPLPRVLDGLFEITRRLYGVEVRAADGVETWHEDVRFFEIRDADGALCGEFYLDPFARPHKRGGAWMDGCVVRYREPRALHTPVAYLTCNFAPPSGGGPACLTHDEVTTLFHEFGHGLHHLLTRVDRPDVAGINGVEWDAVELPSQLMESWCWESGAIALMSGHVETGAPLPGEQCERLLAARHFQTGMRMLRQLEFALFDFRLHLEYDPAAGGRVPEVLAQVRDEVAVVRPPEYNRFAHAFGHIFSGGYAAGYYSYKWAETLAADAYTRFRERGIFDRATGLEFRRNVLERGGSRDAMDLFVAFLGREPGVDALLQASGIEPAGAAAEPVA